MAGLFGFLFIAVIFCAAIVSDANRTTPERIKYRAEQAAQCTEACKPLPMDGINMFGNCTCKPDESKP